MAKKFNISKFFYNFFINNWYLLGLAIVLCVLGYWISLFMIIGIILFLINLIISIFLSVSFEKISIDNSANIQGNLENDVNEYQNEDDLIQTIYKNCEEKIKILDEKNLDNSKESMSTNNLSIMARNINEEVNVKMSLNKIGLTFFNECMPFKDKRDSLFITVNTQENPTVIFIFRFETYSSIKDLRLVISYQDDNNEVIEKVDKKIKINNKQELERFLLSENIIKQITEKSLEISKIKVEEKVVLNK